MDQLYRLLQDFLVRHNTWFSQTSAPVRVQFRRIAGDFPSGAIRLNNMHHNNSHANLPGADEFTSPRLEGIMCASHVRLIEDAPTASRRHAQRRILLMGNPRFRLKHNFRIAELQGIRHGRESHDQTQCGPGKSFSMDTINPAIPFCSLMDNCVPFPATRKSMPLFHRQLVSPEPGIDQRNQVASNLETDETASRRLEDPEQRP